jgi:hypothetical protein
MDALAAADISLSEGFRLDRRAGVLFRRDHQSIFTPIAIGRRELDILAVLVERPGDLELTDLAAPAAAHTVALCTSNIQPNIGDIIHQARPPCMRRCADHRPQPSLFCMLSDGPPITQRTSGLALVVIVIVWKLLLGHTEQGN